MVLSLFVNKIRKVTYRACTTTNDLVKGQSIRDAIRATGRRAARIIGALRAAALLGIDGAT